MQEYLKEPLKKIMGGIVKLLEMELKKPAKLFEKEIDEKILYKEFSRKYRVRINKLIIKRIFLIHIMKCR